MDDGGRASLVLTFGPPQHEAEALAVLLLQEHRLLLDYIVAAGGDRQRVKSQSAGPTGGRFSKCLPLFLPPTSCPRDDITTSTHCTFTTEADKPDFHLFPFFFEFTCKHSSTKGFMSFNNDIQ